MDLSGQGARAARSLFNGQMFPPGELIAQSSRRSKRAAETPRYLCHNELLFLVGRMTSSPGSAYPAR
jgi:hypothetical protein